MAMRDLVAGGAACAVPGSSSNPLAALANALIGSSSKTQERLNEIPTTVLSSSVNVYGGEGHLPALPGSEFDHADAQTSKFLHSFHSAKHNDLSDAWLDIQRPPDSDFHPPSRDAHPQPILDGPPQRILSTFLQSFINSSHQGIPFRPASLPVLGLSDSEKLCIRDRSSIMARHLFADKNEEYIHAQVNALLSSLEIDSEIPSEQHVHERYREYDRFWNESSNTKPSPVDAWADDFSNKLKNDAWIRSFENNRGAADGWATEFQQEQSQLVQQPDASRLAVMEQTRMLEHTLSQNDDPKFRNSKFLQFLSKMSRGDITTDGEDWASEYRRHASSVPVRHDHWANEFGNERAVRPPPSSEAAADADRWADEFSNLHINDWAEEFGRRVGEGVVPEDEWAASYDEYLNERTASPSAYEFSNANPYVGHPAPLREGQELFRKGLLSEVVLALEAEVLKNPDNAEGWRLLGIAHAENDDDHQSIASMMRAHDVEPANLEVLLALGVSHTNELEQTAALRYLYSWLCHHPKYGSLASSALSETLYIADVMKVFGEAVAMGADDADVRIVMGVLYNLSREFDRAIESFRMALTLKPQDYSLWNKLGATQANSVQSADAILAYRQALDLKPNYVRAWTNMGISYANQGLFQESVRYYVRALSMNPKAENAWQYLRLSLGYSSRPDMVDACRSRNLDLLLKEFPL